MENKITQAIQNLLQTKRQKVIALVSGIVLITLIVGIVLIAVIATPKVSSETLFPTMELIGELTTVELKYSGNKEYKDSGLPFLNRSDFLMTYEASLRAGINMEEVEIEVNNLTKTIYITLPDAEIQTVKVDPDSIKYYDEKFSLFNFNSKEDANKAQEQAEQEAKLQAEKMGVLEYANDHAEKLIIELLQNAVPKKYKIVIK